MNGHVSLVEVVRDNLGQQRVSSDLILPFFLQIVLRVFVIVGGLDVLLLLDAFFVLLLVGLDHRAAGYAEVLLVLSSYKVHIRKLLAALIILLRFVGEVPILVGVRPGFAHHARLSVSLAHSRVRLLSVFI